MIRNNESRTCRGSMSRAMITISPLRRVGSLSISSSWRASRTMQEEQESDSTGTITVLLENFRMLKVHSPFISVTGISIHEVLFSDTAPKDGRESGDCGGTGVVHPVDRIRARRRKTAMVVRVCHFPHTICILSLDPILLLIAWVYPNSIIIAAKSAFQSASQYIPVLPWCGDNSTARKKVYCQVFNKKPVFYLNRKVT